MQRKIKLVIVLLILSSLRLFSQKVESFSYLKAQFPGEKVLILNKSEDLNISLEDDKLNIKNAIVREKYFLTGDAQQYADEYIHYSSFSGIEDIKAFLYIPKGKKYKKIKVDQIKETDDYSANIFYDDTKEIQLIFPKIEDGYKTYVSYKRIIKNPRFLGQFYFLSYLFIVEARYSVSFPANVKIKYKLFNNDSNYVKFSEKKEKDVITYTWTAQHVPQYDYEPNSVPLSYFAPNVVVYIDEYETSKGPEKILSDVGELYNWYYSLTKDINTGKDEILETIVDSLVAGLTDDNEKAKAIFYWVQDNIKYVAFEDGLGGFKPRPAADVCHKRYGDCKDMASILSKMLRTAGLSAYLTWVGSRDIPYSYYDISTPIVDNHMIVALESDSNYIFLDATSKYLPFDIPPYYIQDKEVLIGKGQDNFDIMKIPIISKTANYLHDSVCLKFENNELFGSGIAVFGGYGRQSLARQILNQSQDEIKETMNGWLEKGNNKFNIDNFNIKGGKSRDDDIFVDYEFTIPDYSQSINNNLYINMSLVKSLYNDYYELDKRKYHEMLNYKFNNTFITLLNIPGGYELDNLPENYEYKGDMFGFEVKYSIQDNKICQSSQIYINTLIIKKEKFQEWNNMMDILNMAYSQVVVLKKNKDFIKEKSN